MNLQTQYNLIKEGKGDKQYFLKSARIQFPHLITNLADYATSVSILTSKQIITEGVAVEKSSANTNWFDTFKQSISEAKKKKDEEEVSKEVKDIQKNAFDSKDTKNLDNLNFNELLHGFYVEMGDEKNKSKSVDEIKQIVAKNLAKDICHYTKDGMFGVKGVGFTDKAPGLGEPKEPKGEFKSSGYGDIKEKNNIVKDSINVAKATSKTTGLKAPLKESLSPSQKKAMKDKWKLSDTEIEERERWNEQIKKGEKTIQDYRNSDLGKKIEKVMNPMLKEVIADYEFDRDQSIYDVIWDEIVKEWGLSKKDMKDEDNEADVMEETNARFEKYTGREPVFLSGLHDDDEGDDKMEDEEINENQKERVFDDFDETDTLIDANGDEYKIKIISKDKIQLTPLTYKGKDIMFPFKGETMDYFYMYFNVKEKDDSNITENYDEVEALEQELMAEKDPEKKAEIETRLLALQGSLEESINIENSESKLKVGDKILFLKDSTPKWKRIINSILSAFYDSKLQPKKGDEFEVIDYPISWEVGDYPIKNINRPEEFKKATNGEETVSANRKWINGLIDKGIIKINDKQSLREQIKAIIKETVDINKVKSILSGLNCKFLEGNNKETEVRYEYWKKLPEDKIKQLEALGYTVEFRDLDADNDTKPQFVNVIKEK